MHRSVPDLVLLHDDNHPARPWLRERGERVSIVYHPGKPFRMDALRSLAPRSGRILVDERLYEEAQRVFGPSIVPLCSAPRHQQPWGCDVDFGGTSSFPFEADASPSRVRGKVLFVCSNDTHVKMFEPIAARLDDAGFIALDRGEGAPSLLQKYGGELLVFDELPYRGATWRDSAQRKMLSELDVSVVVFGNDWSREERTLVQWARDRKIPSVCMQEGPQDFDMPGVRQLRGADHVFVQGPATVSQQIRTASFVTGNPRYHEHLAVPMPSTPSVLINSNFTYGVEEENRFQWLTSAASACNEVGLHHFVCRHPRESVKIYGLTYRDSSAYHLRDHLTASSVVISRFSSLIYEAVLMGRPAVYYNPHGERMGAFGLGANHGAVSVARDLQELKSVLASLLDTGTLSGGLSSQAAFSDFHCVPDGQAIERSILALRMISHGRIRHWPVLASQLSGHRPRTSASPASMLQSTG